MVDWLDERTVGGSKILISEHEDQLRRVERGYGTATMPEDYLESFRKYIEENKVQVAAIQTVCQRPRDLSRKELRELQLLLDAQGFTETHLRTAVRETTNQDIAATIIGHIRHVALGLPLLPYEQRVDKAIQEILASRPWTDPQRRWLQRIGKQLEQDTIVDRDALDQGSFKEHGGFARLNKVFDGKLEQLLHEIADTVWKAAA